MRLKELLCETVQDDQFINDITAQLRTSKLFKKYLRFSLLKKMMGHWYPRKQIKDFVNISTEQPEHQALLDVYVTPYVKLPNTLGHMSVTQWGDKFYVDVNVHPDAAIETPVLNHELMHALEWFKSQGKSYKSAWGRGKTKVSKEVRRNKQQYVNDPGEWNAAYAESVAHVQTVLQLYYNQGVRNLTAQQLQQLAVIVLRGTDIIRHSSWIRQPENRIYKRFVSRLFKYAEYYWHSLLSNQNPS